MSDEELKQLLPSGTQGVFVNRVVGWARTYLQKAGLLASPGRGQFQITLAGQALLAQNPQRINNSLLMNYPSFVEFRSRKSSGDPLPSPPLPDQEILSPEEQLITAYENLRRNLEVDLLEKVQSSSPAFFEKLVVDLMIAMGYGGNRADAGRAIGQTGDGGIDGVINEDRLGLDTVYLQAKRWQGTVGRPEVQKFAGALQGQRAKKGVFITTSDFTADAKNFAANLDSRLILIDGKLLAQLMVEHQVGVTTTSHYEVKRIDLDYFQED